MSSLGVVIGRFQTPYLHEGHKILLNYALSRHDKVLVLVGQSPLKSTSRNPLSYIQRKVMLTKFHPRIIVRGIADGNSDELWSLRVDKTIKTHSIGGLTEDAVLYGGRDSFIPYYSGTYPTLELPNSLENLSATEIRKDVDVVGEREYLEGVIFGATNRWVNAVPCVDMAIVDGIKVLLGRKKGATQYQFIGGFVDSGETYEDAAIREVKEETQLTVSDLRYLKSYTINDWRYASEEAKITSALFLALYEGGTPVASDDIVEVRWFDTDYGIDIVSGHAKMLEEVKRAIR